MRGFHASGSALGKAWLSVCAMTALAAVAPANATIRVATYTGTLGNGYDKTVIFGEQGWISHLPYSVSYTRGFRTKCWAAMFTAVPLRPSSTPR